MRRGLYIAFLGGDKREVILGEALQEAGFMVRYAGFENYPRAGGLAHVTLEDALADSRVAIAPLAGIADSGALKAPYALKALRLSRGLLACMERGSLLMAGSLPENMAAFLKAKGIRVLVTGDRDDVACLNAVPTAEGALQYAMTKSEITLQDSFSLVTGFGRCAKALAWRLQALGSRVAIAARKGSALAEASMYGYRGVPLRELGAQVKEFDFIFNTVPVLLFTGSILQAVKPGSVIIDIASKPGGVDLKAAQKIPCTALTAPGLPGEVAPVTAGRILAKTYVPLILRHLEGENLDRGGENSEA